MKNQVLIKVVKTKIQLDLFCFFLTEQKGYSQKSNSRYLI